ncbi:hypothetical protein GGTG_10703 [Gaeumannomyces tritici R3-111a-1]|uniref:Uncharacterized protein n=1 Tax=Gaeumannomyces tritici (strain R3-111a-1) TaxID=644352 RepID=J3PB29_GAET3|nr:hypothetical protein GGTG_10703 [Gaeumannomyces tritici R3-111a-1]EJT71445.1 hypothetical protein GGTG_10703 [Gaeumannomyces tritici R3-111a-1]
MTHTSPSRGDRAPRAARRRRATLWLYGRRSSSGNAVNSYLLQPQRHEEITRRMSSILGSKPPRGCCHVQPDRLQIRPGRGRSVGTTTTARATPAAIAGAAANGRAPAVSRAASETRAGPRRLAGFIEYRQASVSDEGGAEAGFYAPRRGRSSGRTCRQKQGTQSDRGSGYSDEPILSPPPPGPGSAELPLILKTSEAAEGPHSEPEHQDRDEACATSDSGRAEAREVGLGSGRNARVNFQGDGIKRDRRADRAGERASSVESHRAETSSVAGVHVDGSGTIISLLLAP